MVLPEIDVTVTPMVVAIGRNWRDAVADETETAVAPGFHVALDAGSEEMTYLNLEAWWGAPERALEAGLKAKALPAEWEGFWRSYWRGEQRFLGLPIFKRHLAVGEVKVWAGAVCAIRSSPKGDEFPWVIAVESALSVATSGPAPGLTVSRHGVDSHRAGQALMRGEHVTPEQSFRYPADDEQRDLVERLFKRSGWLFAILESTPCVLAVSELEVEQPRVG